MSAIAIPKNCTHSALFDAIAEAGVMEATDTKIALQIPTGCFVSPPAMAYLAAWGHWKRSNGCVFKIVGDPDPQSYLSRMDLFAALDVEYDETSQRLAEAGRFIPVKLIRNDKGCLAAVNAICDLVVHQFPTAREFVPAMEWAVNEVTDNILVHSESDTPGAVCAQYFPKKNRLEIGISDMGRGIKASMSTSHPNLWSHGDAITKALQRGATSNPEVGQGNGLTGTRDIAQANMGSFQLWSGDACFKLRSGKDDGFTQIPSTPGTGAMISLNTERPVRLEDTFIGDSAWTYLEAEAERIEDSGGFKIAEECHHFGSRIPAKALRNKVLSLMPEMEGPILFDFEGVDGPSSSFLDELLGRLADHMGEEAFRERVRMVNASETVRSMANVVIGQRLGKGI